MIRNWLNHKVNDQKYGNEVITVPGQTESLPNIIKKLQSGIPVNGTVATYDEIGFKCKDLTEVHRLKEQLFDLRGKIERQEAKAKEAREKHNASQRALLKKLEEDQNKTSN